MNQNKSRRLVTVLHLLMVVGVLMLQYAFSAQPAEISGSISGGLAEQLMSIFGQQGNAQLVEQWDVILRKLAHFTLYFLLGYGLMGTVRSKKPIWAFSIAIGIGAICAACDEFHQNFVEGRGPSIRDVLLDSAGVIVGAFVCYGVIRLWRRRKSRRNQIPSV